MEGLDGELDSQFEPPEEQRFVFKKMTILTDHVMKKYD